jgi:hypothetical protein
MSTFCIAFYESYLFTLWTVYKYLRCLAIYNVTYECRLCRPGRSQQIFPPLIISLKVKMWGTQNLFSKKVFHGWLKKGNGGEGGGRGGYWKGANLTNLWCLASWYIDSPYISSPIFLRFLAVFISLHPPIISPAVSLYLPYFLIPSSFWSFSSILHFIFSLILFSSPLYSLFLGFSSYFCQTYEYFIGLEFIL